MNSNGTERERTHHDRKGATAADTWGEEPIDSETALELAEKLQEAGYEVRLTVEASHPDSAVVKTVDSQDNANETLANIRAVQPDTKQ
jgi:hypothetical protein